MSRVFSNKKMYRIKIWNFLCHTYFSFNIPYARHHNPRLIRNHSWILTIHKARILRKKLLEKTFLDFKKWVKTIQTAGYNDARTVLMCCFMNRAKMILQYDFKISWALLWKYGQKKKNMSVKTCWLNKHIAKVLRFWH